jgi:hypothetical protein
MFLELFLSHKYRTTSAGFLLGLDPEDGEFVRNFELSPILTALQPRRLFDSCSVQNSEVVTVTCSYKLLVFNKSNYQFKPFV